MDLDDVRYLGKEDSLNGDNFVEEGDILFTRLSGSIELVANCVIVSRLGGKRLQYPDRHFCARLINTFMNEYVELCFANPRLREELTSRAKSSAGHQRVSISDICGQRIPVLPKEEHDEIVRQARLLFDLADCVKARYEQATLHVGNLTKSLLAKTLQSELVPEAAEEGVLSFV